VKKQTSNVESLTSDSQQSRWHNASVRREYRGSVGGGAQGGSTATTGGSTATGGGSTSGATDTSAESTGTTETNTQDPDDPD
jgi:hypothetical protein